MSCVGKDPNFLSRLLCVPECTEHGCNKFLNLTAKSEENHVYVTDYDVEEVENSNSVAGGCTL